MGALNETKDNCLDVTNSDDDLLKKYWDDKSKTEEEKIEEIKNYVEPIFNDSKKYYNTYIEGDWFTKKIKEKIIRSNKNPLKKLNKKNITTWGNKEKTDLKNFINLIEISYTNSCEEGQVGFVTPMMFNIVNICVKSIYPSEDKSFIYQVIIHEIKHTINSYFMEKGIKISPKNVPGPIITDKKTAYSKSSDENSSRIQNLRILLGVDDFGSIENFIKLLKDKLVIKNEKIQPPIICNIEYNNKEMKINTGFDVDTKTKNLLLNLSFYFDGKNNIDVRYLFNAYSTVSKTTNEILITVNLENIFNYTQDFALLNNKEKNIDVS
jgi:hypothetical protein